MSRDKRFSERYGYKPFSEEIILGRITPELQNALCSCFDRLDSYMYSHKLSHFPFFQMQEHLWTKFHNKRKNDFDQRNNVVCNYISSPDVKWFDKFDIIEEALYYLSIQKKHLYQGKQYFVSLKDDLNEEFERLNAGYRVVDRYITDIINKEEIDSVTTAIAENEDSVKEHLQKAIMHYSRRPEADYRNSIKESISAVEAYCRKKTGENTLGKALKHLEDAGIEVPQMLKIAFEKLYAYANDGDTGIRHALIEGDSIPTNAEALFMLVSCSAFINYMNMRS